MNACYRLLMIYCFLYLCYIYHEGMLHHTHPAFSLIQRYMILGTTIFLLSLFLPDAWLWVTYPLLYIGIKCSYGTSLRRLQELSFFAAFVISMLIYQGIQQDGDLYRNHLLFLFAHALLLFLMLYSSDKDCPQIYMYAIWLSVFILLCIFIHPKLPSIDVLLLFFWLLYLLLLHLYRMSYCLERQKHDELIAQRQAFAMNEQQTRYEQIQKENAYILKTMHDLKKHLQILDAMDHDSVQAYRQEIKQRTEALINHQVSGNEIIDKVLQLYQLRFREANIQWHLECDEISYTSIDQIDLCAVLCNLLDNAFESCLKCEERFILFRMHQNKHQIFWKMKNSCVRQELQEREFPHGFGLQNVEEIAHRYGGSLQIDKEEEHGIFTSIVTFSKTYRL